MALFDVLPISTQKIIRPNYFSGSKADNFLLALSGYKKDGSANLFGKITDFLPGVGILKNLGAQAITKGTDSFGNVKDNMDNATSKGMIGFNVGKIAAGAITGNPNMVKSGIQGAIGGAGSLVGAGAGPNYADDIKVKNIPGIGSNNYYNNDYNSAVSRRTYNDINSSRGSLFKDGGVILDKNFYSNPKETAIQAISPDDPDFVAKVATASLLDNARKKIVNTTGFQPMEPVKAGGITSGVSPEFSLKSSAVNIRGVDSSLIQLGNLFNSIIPTEATSLKDQHDHGSHVKGFGADFVPRNRNEFDRFDAMIQAKMPEIKSLGYVAMREGPQINGKANHWHFQKMKTRFEEGGVVEDSIDIFKKGGPIKSPLKAGITREIAFKILNAGEVSGRKLSPKQIDYFKRYLPKKAKMEDGGVTFVPYADNDHTEDFYMVDKMKAAEVGVSKLISNIAFGEARYNERIFDQKANLAMKMIIGSNVSEDKKKDALGNLVYDELKTHSDIKLIEPAKKDRVISGQYFASGGAPENTKNFGGRTHFTLNGKVYLLDDKGTVFELDKKGLNEKGIIDVGFGDSNNTLVNKAASIIQGKPYVAAGSVGNSASNGRPVSFQQPEDKPKVALQTNGRPVSFQQPEDKPKIGSTGSGPGKVAPKTTAPKTSATTAGLNAYQNDFYDAKYPNPLGIQNPFGIPDYRKMSFDANQATPLSEIAKANVSQKPISEISGRLYDNQSNLGVNSLPSASSGIKVKTPQELGTNPIPQKEKSLTGIFDGIQSGLGLIAGFAAASEKVPDFVPNQDFIDRQNQIKSQANMGFTPTEVAQFNKNKNDSYNIGVQSIVNSAGGGANQGAILGSLNNLQGQRIGADINFAIQDNNKMMQNQAIYDRALNQQLALDQNLYANKVNFINQNRNMGAQLIQSTLQDIEDRNLQEKSNELNGTINEYYRSLIDTNKNRTDKMVASRFGA